MRGRSSPSNGTFTRALRYGLELTRAARDSRVASAEDSSRITNSPVATLHHRAIASRRLEPGMTSWVDTDQVGWVRRYGPWRRGRGARAPGGRPFPEHSAGVANSAATSPPSAFRISSPRRTVRRCSLGWFFYSRMPTVLLPYCSPRSYSRRRSDGQTPSDVRATGAPPARRQSPPARRGSLPPSARPRSGRPRRAPPRRPRTRCRRRRAPGPRRSR